MKRDRDGRPSEVRGTMQGIRKMECWNDGKIIKDNSQFNIFTQGPRFQFSNIPLLLVQLSKFITVTIPLKIEKSFS